ncbi:Hypothetical protein PBC10988_20300 [Planctomycetales bacterium 10988]|nr:Hypothetical protein PBC10988_20300 [Planctomycetales bacterium 10988]
MHADDDDATSSQPEGEIPKAAHRPSPNSQSTTAGRAQVYPIQWLLLGMCLFTLAVTNVMKIHTVDVPWHLATARLAWEQGYFPATNSFSYTFPEYPLYQQYPLFQSVLFTVYQWASWEGLSLLMSAYWFGSFLIWSAWGGGLRQVARLNAAWVLVIYAFFLRDHLRPELQTLLLLGCLLLAMDLFRKRPWLGGCAIVFVQWCLANTHQMFTVGLALIVSFLIHAVMVRLFQGRLGVSREDEKLPLLYLSAVVVAAGLACFLTPLGTEVIGVPLKTMGSLTHHREEVQEFAPFYTSLPATILVTLSTLLLALHFLLTRKRWQPFEVALALLGIVLILGAIRGLPFYVVICVALFSRGRFRLQQIAAEQGPEQTTPHIQVQQERRAFAQSLFTLPLCLMLLMAWWLSPEKSLWTGQRGWGRSAGDWPDTTMAFLKESPPPGKMLNMSWFAGNALIWEGYPQFQVYVDPRLEAYPRDFLVKTIDARKDEALLQELVERFDCSWFVGEMRLPEVRRHGVRLLESGEWKLVQIDPIFFVLVEQRSETEDYLEAHGLDPSTHEVASYTPDPEMRPLQELIVAGWYQSLGQPERAKPILEKIEQLAETKPYLQKAFKSFQRESSLDKEAKAPLPEPEND